MSISVQQLVQTAFQNCSLIGDGESVDGTAYGTTAHDGALGLLNNLLSELNNQGYIVSSFSEHQFTYSGPTVLVGQTRPSSDRVIFLGDGRLPSKIEGVSRQVGSRWLPLHSCDRQTMDMRTKMQLPTSWTYELSHESGILFLDTNRPTVVKFWFKDPIENVDVDIATIRLSEIYFDLLLNGLCVKLCVKYKLTDYLPIFEQQFKQAKNLIKRSNATQRMIQRGDLGGGYNDSFYNGLGGVGW